MSLVIRPYHWFFALILSALMHGWVIHSVNFFQFEPIEKQSMELPFTVLLSDQEVAEEMVLEDPEALSSDVIPLVSLDEEGPAELEAIEAAEEIVSMGESLEWVPAGEQAEISATESEEVALDAQAEVSVPKEQVINLLESSELAPEPEATVPSLNHVAVLAPESLMQMREREPIPVEVLELEPEVMAPVDTLPEVAEMAELSETVDLPLEEEVALQSELAMPEVSQQSEVILAEITIEQIEFDEAVLSTLPEVKAEEWKPQLPSLSEKQARGWKRRYAGASGIGAKYRKQMRSTLTQFVLYPKAVAEEQGIEGKVVIGFTINREGRLEETEILESSGHPALDQAVEKMVEFAQPFTQLPKSVKNDKVKFAFPVTIKLKR